MKDYKKHKGRLDEKMELVRYRMKCRYKREEILRSYIEELKGINSSIDYDAKVREYYDSIEKEDVETLEMKLMVYPYLLLLIRDNEENEGISDGK